MWKAPLFLLIRLGVLVLAGWICRELAMHMGVPLGVGIWCAAMGIVCGVTAYAMHRVPIGEIGLANYLGAMVLPFGYRLGNGKLLPIFAISWAVWTAAGAAVMLLSANGFEPRQTAPDGAARVTLLTVLLWLSWAMDAAAILYLLRVLVTRLGFASRSAPQMMLLIAILIAMIAGSATLWSSGQNGWAVMLAGGPLLVLGGSYGIFLAVALIAKPRWN